jgi:hypothetical protein
MRPDLSFSRTILTFSRPPIYSSENIHKNQIKMSINGSSEFNKKSSVAGPGCFPGSRILIFTHPGSRIPDLGSRIADPKTATKERDEKKLLSYLFL